MSRSLGLFRHFACSAGLIGLSALGAGCLEAPPPDVSYQRVDVSQEVFRVFCRRVAKDAYPVEVDGQRFYAICDGLDEDGDPADPELEKQKQLRAILRRRPEIIAGLDRAFAFDRDDNLLPGTETFADGELSGFLKALVPLYDKPNETVPTATRGIAQLLAQLIDPEDERAQKVLATVERLANRTGYRTPDRNLGAIRALLTYDGLDQLAELLLPVVSAGGVAHDQFVAVLNAAALELADEPVAVPDLDATTLHTAIDVLLREDKTQATNNVGAAPVLYRQKGSGDADGSGPSPFPVPGRDDNADRDGNGLAQSGGDAAYKTFDASQTLLASLMRETSWLIGRGDKDRSPLESFAHGLKPLLGPWGQRTELIGKNNYQFDGPDVSKSALLDVAHAFASMARYPEAGPMIRTLDLLIREHESEATHFDSAALKIDEISDEPQYDSAKLNGPHELWDDLIAVAARLATRPKLFEELVRSFVDPRSGAQGKLFAAWMRHNDRVSYPNSPSTNPDDINAKVAQKYESTVDREAPNTGFNRSIWQRTMSLINALNGVQVCNKDAALLNVNTGIGLLTFPFGNPAGYKRCELIEIQDAVEIYSQAVIGKSQIAIKDSFATVLSIFGSLTGISGSVAQIQEGESKITGFTDKPTPASLARFIFAPQNKFLTDLFVPQETVDKLPIAQYEPDALFPLELVDERTDIEGKASSFIEMGVPLIEAFDKCELRNPLDNKLLDGYMFGHLLSVMHRHWPARSDEGCPPTAEEGREGCTQHLDPAAPLYSPQTGLNSYEELLARALDDEGLVEVLHEATIALAAIKVTNFDGQQIDGITALGNFAQRIATPDPTLKKRDGSLTTKTNLGKDVPVLSVLNLVADGLKAMDDTFADAESDRLKFWREGRSGILDQVLTVEQNGNKYSLRDRTAFGIVGPALDFVAKRIEEHQKAGDLVAWADGLSGRATTILRHPLTAATVDLLDAFWDEEEASGEFTKVAAFLTNEDNEESYLGMLTAAADTLILLDRDANLSPAIQFAALGLAPNAFKAIEGTEGPNGDKSVAYAGLELTGGVVKELAKKRKEGEKTALSKLLRNAVMGDVSVRSPLEVLIDAAADVNREDETALPETPLTAEENRDVFTDVKGFLYDDDQEKRSLERLYSVIQGRKN